MSSLSSSFAIVVFIVISAVLVVFLSFFVNATCMYLSIIIVFLRFSFFVSLLSNNTFESLSLRLFVFIYFEHVVFSIQMVAIVRSDVHLAGNVMLNGQSLSLCVHMASNT